jgi:hypothetical protein
LANKSINVTVAEEHTPERFLVKVQTDKNDDGKRGDWMNCSAM